MNLIVALTGALATLIGLLLMVEGTAHPPDLATLSPIVTHFSSGTSVCFMLVGLSLLCALGAKRSARFNLLLALLGSVVIALSTLGIFSSFEQALPGERWLWPNRISFQASVFFAIIGVSIVILAYRFARAKHAEERLWLSVPITLAMSLTITLVLWYSLLLHDNAYAGREVMAKADNLRVDVEKELSYHLEPLRRSASRWSLEAVNPLDVRITINLLEATTDYFQALAILDPGVRISHAQPSPRRLNRGLSQ